MPQDLVELLLWLRRATVFRASAPRPHALREGSSLAVALAVLGGY